MSKTQPFRVHPTLSKTTYERLVTMAREEGCSPSRMASIGLDRWIHAIPEPDPEGQDPTRPL